MKCKICGNENIVEENGQFVCKVCGAVFFEKPEDEVDAIIKEAKEAIEAREAEDAAKKEAEEKAAADAEAELKAEEERLAQAALEEYEREPVAEEKTEEPEKEEETPAPAVNTEPKIFEEGEPLYEAEKMADEVVEEAEEEPAPEEEKEEKKKKSALREVLDFCLPIIIALIVAMLLKTFVFANAQVPTGSMLNTIQEGDRIIASRLEYNFHDPERYDIIIFKFPDDVAAHKEDPTVKVEYFVKRIIGLPGETVTIVNGVVYVTDKDGKSTQLKDDFVTACTPTGNFGPYEVPEGSYFVMGDNRESSIDSRFWTTTNYVDESLIIGKVKFRYYPSVGKIE